MSKEHSPKAGVLTLCSGDGSLTIKADGWSVLSFAEAQAVRDGEGFLNFEIPPSELREIADFINDLLAKNALPSLAKIRSRPPGTPPWTIPEGDHR